MQCNNTINDNNEDNEDQNDINSWDDLMLNNSLLRGIYSCGYENPSPIQQRAIKPMSMKKDIVAQAQSGTCKTAAFTIGALSNIDVSNNNTQILVLSPTKELTVQTAKVFENIGAMIEGLRISTAYGGVDINYLYTII